MQTQHYSDNMPNEQGTYITAANWKDIQSISMNNDKDLQAALENSTFSGDGYGNRMLNIDAQAWNGMQSGAIKYDSTQTSNWLSTIPSKYKKVAKKWMNQNGMLKITPIQQRQKFTYSTVAYIAAKQEEPKTQIVPISDVSVVPHQITFDFYDTTEGRIGVSNAVEKHMTVECDIYLTDLVATYWAFGGDGEYNYGLDTFPKLKKRFWNDVREDKYLNVGYDVECTREFADFRSTFLQQHLGWICMFTSHAFGAFRGVLTDISYDINSGESFAKWHIKMEEALFMNESYSTTGQKPDDSETSNGSTTTSGNANTQENIDTSTSDDTSTT